MGEERERDAGLVGRGSFPIADELRILSNPSAQNRRMDLDH
jgi:hypothetical protein